MTGKKEVAKTNGSGALAIPDEFDLPEGCDGMEEADSSAFAIPFLRLLQKGSPQVDTDSDAHIPGTKAGMIYNTVTGEVYDPEKEDIYFIQAFFRKAYVEWKPREAGGGGGGGFVKEYPPTEGEELMRQTTLDDKNRDMLPNGNQLKDTRYHYVVMIHGDELIPAVIAMDRTQVKRSKRLASAIRQKMDAEGLRHSSQLRFKVETEVQTKDDNTWRIWDIKDPVHVTDQNQLNNAIRFYKAITSGAVREAIETLDEDVVATTGKDAAAKGNAPAASEPATF
jgi:hypothetical protein